MDPAASPERPDPERPDGEPSGAKRPGAGRPDPALGERELAMLAFERQWWRSPGAKDQAIRDGFGLSPTRYYQLLNALLDDPAALAADPVLVKRLRRLRAAGGRRRGRPGG
jgi:uncharacterized protein DUF3263